MSQPTFEKLKKQLDEACEFLRGFTLGRNGYSQKGGRDGIKRVTEICERLSKLPETRWGEPATQTIVAQGRGRIKAAEARLALLQAKR